MKHLTKMGATATTAPVALGGGESGGPIKNGGGTTLSVVFVANAQGGGGSCVNAPGSNSPVADVIGSSPVAASDEIVGEDRDYGVQAGVDPFLAPAA